MPLPPGFVLEGPQRTNLPPGFVLEGQIQDLNSTEHLDAPQTMGRRLRNLPVVGDAINRLIGPEMDAPTLIGGQHEGVLNQLVQGLSGPLLSSPAMGMRQPQSYPEAVLKGVAEQVNPQNILLGGGLGALHKAQEAGPLVDWLKATIAAYFAKQGVEMGGSALGERTAGAPVTPERKGELDVQTLMGTLMGLGPLLGMKGERPKQTDVGPPSANLTIPDVEMIEGRVPPERRLPSSAQSILDRLLNPPPKVLGDRPGQVPFLGLEQRAPVEEQRVAGAGPLVEKRASQEVPRIIGEPIIGQKLVQPNVPEGFVLEQASQPQGEPKQGGQISFSSEAKGGGIPSARQTAVEDVRPAVRAMDGRVLVGQRGQVHNDIIEQNNLLPTNIDRRMFVDAKGNEISREQLAQMGVPDVDREVPGAHAPELAKVQEGTPIEERGARGGNIAMLGMFDPANYRPTWDLLKEFKGKVMDGNQIINRLRNKLHPDEWKMYEDMGIVQAFGNKRVDPKEVATWMQDNGPRVEVRKFGEGAKTELVKGGLKLKPTAEQLKERGREGAVTKDFSDIADRFVATLDVLKDAAKRRGIKGDITALNRAVDNLSFRAQAQAENHMKLEASKQFGDKSQTALNAMFAMLEGTKAGGLATALAKSAKNKDMREAVKFAMDPANQAGLQSMVGELKKLDQQNLAFAKANGVDIPSIEDYLKHSYGSEPRPFFFFEKPSPGIGMGSKMARKFPTIFDAIEAGHKPLSLDAAAMVGKRTQEIFQEVQTKKWLDGFRTVNDPATGEPVVADLGKMGLPPDGYSKVNGLNVAIKDGYKSIFTALTGESHISNNMLGQLLLEGEGAVKHGTLAFDVFHAARIAQFAKSFSTKVGYRKGLSLLEYSEKDLNEAVKQGLAPKEALDYQKEVRDLPQGKYTNRQLGSIAIQEGANVGRHSEALYTSFVRTFPGLKQTVGRFNRWVFDKMSRGALHEANVSEIVRIANARPDLTIRQVARMVTRDTNYRMGSIQKQGLIKGKTVQDISQIIFLAPKWFESLGQSEARSAGQVVRSLTPGQHLGSLGFSSAKLLTAYILGTQAINLIFNGHTTFQNKNNKGHEIDAYIPPLTKDGKGFYISPLSVVGELSHDMLRYTRQSDKTGTVDRVLDAAGRIVENKLSPPIHGLEELKSGKDYKGEKVEGWNRVLDAFVTGVNPSPLPVRQTVQSLKEKDVAPAERQAFSMLGIKAEPESYGDVRQRKIEELGKAPFSERAKLEKDLKALRPTSSDSAKLAAGQRAMEAQLQRKNALREKLPDNIQGWLKNKKLDIQGFVPEITKNKQRITLTEREREWFLSELTNQYTKYLTPWVGQDVTQERLNSRLLQARNIARRNLLNAIQSDSISESDQKERKKKRFSFMGGD
jgi:hypothetical protein